MVYTEDTEDEQEGRYIVSDGKLVENEKSETQFSMEFDEDEDEE